MKKSLNTFLAVLMFFVYPVSTYGTDIALV